MGVLDLGPREDLISVTFPPLPLIGPTSWTSIFIFFSFSKGRANSSNFWSKFCWYFASLDRSVLPFNVNRLKSNYPSVSLWARWHTGARLASSGNPGPDMNARYTITPSLLRTFKFWVQYDFPMNSITWSTPSVTFLISSSKSTRQWVHG
jgi:hypothetical protein